MQRRQEAAGERIQVKAVSHHATSLPKVRADRAVNKRTATPKGSPANGIIRNANGSG
jgi:hypothetical protein